MRNVSEFVRHPSSLRWPGPLAVGLSFLVLAVCCAVAQGSTPPMQIVWDLHADPIPGPTVGAQHTNYLLRVTAGEFAMDQADRTGAIVSFLMCGQFAEWVLDDPAGQPLLLRLLASGGQLGTHSHNNLRVGVHDWVPGPDFPTAEQKIQNWVDHVGWVNAAITAVTGTSDPDGLSAINSDRGAGWPQEVGERLDFLKAWHFKLHEAGEDEEFYAYFSHYAMNPFCPSASAVLTEDPAGTIVLVPHGSVIGVEQLHFGILQDNRLEVMQARFLLNMLNWLHDSKIGGTDRVWTYGWGSHLHDLLPGEPSRAALPTLLDWLNDHFIGVSVGGASCAEWASMEATRSLFESWRTAHPGDPSFSYPATTTDWDVYPYLVPAAQYLVGTEYVEPMPSHATVRWHRLVRPSGLPPYNVYVAYTTDGSPISVDLSAELGVGTIAVVNPATGDYVSASTTSVGVPPEGVILTPVDHVLAVSEPPGGTAGLPTVYPNPMHGASVIRFDRVAPGAAQVEIFDAAGRRVRTLSSLVGATGSLLVKWDRRDDQGQPVAPGAYWVHLAGVGSAGARKLIVN